MKKALENFIRQKVKSPSEKEINEILEIFEPKHFEKKEVIKKPFTISKELIFLADGTVKGTIIKENGEEAIFRLIQENSFIGDAISIKSNEPTPIGFECLSPSVILVAPITKIYQLLDTNLALNIVLRQYITDSAIELGRKYLLFLTAGAKERYEFMIENNPNLLKKFPLRIVASLIGVTPTQLSRIRNKRSD